MDISRIKFAQFLSQPGNETGESNEVKNYGSREIGGAKPYGSSSLKGVVNAEVETEAASSPQKEAQVSEKRSFSSRSPSVPISNGPSENQYSYYGNGNSGGGKKIGIIIGSILAIIVLFVIVLTAVLATRIWDPMWSPFRPKPEIVLAGMASKMAEAKSVHSKINFGMSANDTATGDNFKLNVKTEGDSDVSDAAKPKMSINANIDTTITMLGGSMGVSLSGQAKTTDNVFYFKLDDLYVPIPGFDQIFEAETGVRLSDVKNNWYKISEADANALNSASGGAQIQQKDLTAKILKMFTTDNIFIVKEQKADEVIGGKNVYHYVITVDKNKVKKAISDAITDSGAPKFLAAAGETAIDEISAKAGELSADVYIGKKDLLLYKAEFLKDLPPSLFQPDAKGKFTVNFTVEYSDFEKPLTVEAPKDAVDLKPIIELSIKKIEENAKVERIQSNMEKIAALAGDIFSEKNSYSLVNCVKDSAVLGPEVSIELSPIQTLCDDIKSLVGETPIFNRTAKKYCASVKLPDGSYWCIDNSLNSKRTTAPCLARTLVCPE